MARRGAAVTVLAACATLALAGCGTTSEQTGGSAEAGKPEKCGADGKYTIGMSQANRGEPYRVRMDDDVQKAGSKVPQFKVELADAQKDSARQAEQVQTFITQKVNLIIVSPNEAAPLTDIVKKAYNARIPVIVLDRKTTTEDYNQWIGADNIKIGEAAGKYFAEKLLPQGGEILEIRGLSSSTPAGERGDGFRKGAGDKIKIVAQADAEWERDIAVTKATELLRSHPNIKHVYAHNDPMAEGVYKAAEQLGRKDIVVTGIDGLPIDAGGIKAVEAGRLAATFVYPTAGKEAIETAKKILVDCQSVAKQQLLQTELVSKENAQQVYTRLNAG
nr:substrate-binding domain-containing protein [Herbihabitans rhizosphaerae]